MVGINLRAESIFLQLIGTPWARGAHVPRAMMLVPRTVERPGAQEEKSRGLGAILGLQGLQAAVHERDHAAALRLGVEIGGTPTLR